MKKTKQEVIDAIVQQGVLPLFYYHSSAVSVEVIKILYNAGIRVIEYTNRGQEAYYNFGALKDFFNAEYPDLLLGVGTIKSVEEANRFIQLQPDFIVSPVIDLQVAEACNKKELLWIPGCMTPSEIHLAQQHNAAIIKLFPASILRYEFVNSIKELFPEQLFIPTGGVEMERDNLTQWFKSGVCAVGLGSKLVSKPVLQEQLYDVLQERTLHMIELVREVRNSLKPKEPQESHGL